LIGLIWAYGYVHSGWRERQAPAPVAGVDQERFAGRSKFSQQYPSDLERGKRNPTIMSLYEIAQALGVSHMDLVQPPTRKHSKTRR
jgi:predicted transcriptional regulator